MRHRFAKALGIAMLASLAGFATSNAETEVTASFRSQSSQVSVSYFYDNLSDDGEWFEEPSYGWCWTPYDMSADWRPYYDGRWEYTDYGWSWASNEPWGWATYHYGRWLFDDSYGWVWVPGTEWAPAWVAWRYNDDYIGWAPLPPNAGWNISAGLSFSDRNSIRSDDWCFVPQSRILDVNIRLQVTSVARNTTLIAQSQDATRFEVRDGRPANIGIDVALVEKHVGRPVPRTTIVDVDTPTRGSGRSVGKGRVGYYRPTVIPASPDQAPPAELTERRNAIPDAVIKGQHEQQKRKLDSDLKAGQARLARDQQNELRGRKAGPDVEETRKRHALEQQAYVAHEARQRQVLDQRIQKRVVKPSKGKATAKSGNQGQGQDRSQEKAQAQPSDQGQKQDKAKAQDKGQSPEPDQDKDKAGNKGGQ